MPLEFKNPEVAKAFDPKRENDVEILIPKVYSGMLSNITPQAAEHLVQIADANLSRKEVTAKAVTPKPEK